jgi:glutaredoxin
MFCGKVKEFLSQNKIEYTERNIAADETALAELEKLGYMTTPVIVIDGEVVVGFDVPKLNTLLRLGDGTHQ